DAYTFDVDKAGLDKSFIDQREAYKRIFSRCGLQYSIVEASSGSMGGSESNEFVAKTDAGEDFIASCTNCDYAANLEKATSRLTPIKDLVGLDAPEEFPTPGVRTIEDLEKFPGGAKAQDQIKTLIYAYIDSNQLGTYDFAIVLLRGEDQLHETKLSDLIGAGHLRQANADEVFDLMGAHPGSLGGVGAREKVARIHSLGFKPPKIIADLSLKGRRNMTT